MTTIPDLFGRLQAQLQSTLFSPVSHPTTTGDSSEIYWGAALRDFLPERYRLGTGFAVDSEGELSQQNDILIYDAQYSPLLWSNGNAVVVPVESVYAVLEVKQVLNKTNFDAAVGKAKAIRRLKPTSAPVTHLTGTHVKKPFIPIAGLLTERCDWSPPFGTSFKTALQSAGDNGQLNIGCALEAGAWAIPEQSDWTAVQVSVQNHALLFLATQLYHLLQALGTVPRIDIPKWLAAGGVSVDEPFKG